MRKVRLSHFGHSRAYRQEQVYTEAFDSVGKYNLRCRAPFHLTEGSNQRAAHRTKLGYERQVRLASEVAAS